MSKEQKEKASIEMLGISVILVICVIMVNIGLQIYPMFVTRYYDECISQQLAPVCREYSLPTWEVFRYYLENVKLIP